MMRSLAAALVAALVLLAPSLAPAQSIPSSTFLGLPSSPAGGTLQWITDGGGTPVPGSVAIGGGVHKDLVSYDATQTRWEFVTRAPEGTSDADLPTLLEGARVGFDGTASGSAANDVQEALDELFAGAGGGGGGGGATNLSQSSTTTTVTIASDTGTDAPIPAATISTAGVMAAADKLGLDLLKSEWRIANPNAGGTTKGIQEAVNSCGSGIGGASPASVGCYVFVPQNPSNAGLSISSTITIGGETLETSKEGVWIVGVGSGTTNSANVVVGGSTLVWAGAAGQPMLKVTGCAHCGVTHLGFDGAGTASAGIAVKADTTLPPAVGADAGSGGITTFLELSHLALRRINGFAIDNLNESSDQVDFLTMYKVAILDSVGCYRQNSIQSVDNVFRMGSCQQFTGPTGFQIDGGELRFEGAFVTSADTAPDNQAGIQFDTLSYGEVYSSTFEFHNPNFRAIAGSTAIGGAGVRDVVKIRGNRFVVLQPGAVCLDWQGRRGHLVFSDNSVAGFSAGTDQGCDLIVNGAGTTNKLTVHASGNSHRTVYTAGEFPGGIYAEGFVPWQVVDTTKTELIDEDRAFYVNPAGINAANGLVDWTQIKGVPAGFADGSDDGSSGGATDLNGLTDVTLVTPAVGATLVWNGTQWVNGPLDLADPDARTGVLPDANVADTITASLYMPLAGGAFSGNVTLNSGVQLIAGPGAAIGPSGSGIAQANQFVGTGTVSSAVDLATAEVNGILGSGNGGLGIASPTSGGILLGTGALPVHTTGVLAAGQLLIGDGTTDPTIAVMSGDATMNSGGVVAFSTGSVDANELVSTGVSPGTYQNANVTVDQDGRVTAISAGSSLLIGSGTKALATSAIAAGACNTDTITAAGVVSTDVVAWSPNADLATVVGFRPISGDGLAIYPPVPGAGSISVKTCNPTGASITPGAASLNWRVAR